MQKAVAIVSGGLDSVTLAYRLHAENYQLHLLAFNYGQRHKKELEYAQLCSQRLNAKFDIIDLSSVGQRLKGSALTDDIDVPEGHYAADNMAVTIVPNRNAIMLSIAYGIAIAENANVVAAGFHSGDHYVYPDCRPEFVKSFETMAHIATETNLRLYAPFINIPKHDIVAIGHQLKVPYADTWSCYKGESLHCGKCGTCVERKEAFQLANVPDLTVYLA